MDNKTNKFRNFESILKFNQVIKSVFNVEFITKQMKIEKTIKKFKREQKSSFSCLQLRNSFLLFGKIKIKLTCNNKIFTCILISLIKISIK